MGLIIGGRQSGVRGAWAWAAAARPGAQKVAQLETEVDFRVHRLADRSASLAVDDMVQVVGAAALDFPVLRGSLRGVKWRARSRSCVAPRVMAAGRLLLVLLTASQAPATTHAHDSSATLCIMHRARLLASRRWGSWARGRSASASSSRCSTVGSWRSRRPPRRSLRARLCVCTRGCAAGARVCQPLSRGPFCASEAGLCTGKIVCCSSECSPTPHPGPTRGLAALARRLATCGVAG